MRRGPESCPDPQKLSSPSPGGWEIQLPTGQIPRGQDTAPCSLLGAARVGGSDPFHLLQFSAAPGSCRGRWSPAGWGSAWGWQAGEAPVVCVSPAPPCSCQSSFPHLGCLASYSPGNVSAWLGAARRRFLPLVVTLQAGLRGRAENRPGGCGRAEPPRRRSCAHPATAGDKGLNPFSVQTSVTRSPSPKSQCKPRPEPDPVGWQHAEPQAETSCLFPWGAETELWPMSLISLSFILDFQQDISTATPDLHQWE